MENRDFKGIWIPKEIYLNKELNWTDKILLLEIDSLDGEYHCVASNKYFADFLGISEFNVSRSISKLKSLGYIEQIDFNGRERTLISLLCYKQQSSLDVNSKAQIYNNIVNKKENIIKENPETQSLTEPKPQLEDKIETQDSSEGELKESSSEKKFMGYTDRELIEKSLINWNEHIASSFFLPKISIISKPRLAKLKKRIKQAGGFLEFWTVIQDAIEQSTFLRNGNETWKCNFDFVLQESSFIKIMEHQYK